jgi:hypothetical protein
MFTTLPPSRFAVGASDPGNQEAGAVTTLGPSGARAWDASHGVEKYDLISRQPCSLTISAKGKTGVAEKMT